ncbi:hypothetical protein I547_3598 [Mycobacterium kansasii 824]|nr:hypothetical protein I547_3598 [Mycobacterium kansasii 824]
MAAALAALNADPMLSTSAAADARNSGSTDTNDIAILPVVIACSGELRAARECVKDGQRDGQERRSEDVDDPSYGS